MLKSLRYTLAALLLFLAGSQLHASQFEEAVKAYGEKNWKKSQNLFEQHLISNSEDAHAYFNLGNCFFQQEKYVDAIWNYEKAFNLDPSLDDVKLLLDKSYQKAGLMSAWTPPVSYFQLKLFRFNSGTWSLVLLGLSVLSGMLLFVYFSSGRKKLLLGLVVLSLLIWGFSCYILYQREHFADSVTHAIVDEPTDAVYLSEKGNAVQEMKLKAGERLKVIEIKERVAVSLEQGQEFWIPKEKLRLIE